MFEAGAYKNLDIPWFLYMEVLSTKDRRYYINRTETENPYQNRLVH